jgi:hypothetical protein
MKMIRNKSWFLFCLTFSIILILPSCKEGETPQKKKVVIDPNKQSEFDNLVSAIDNSNPTDMANSLRFENDEFRNKEIYLYKYENISCTKWEYFEDKYDGGSRIVKFYFKDGKLFHSSETITDANEVRQTNSYYNENMQGIYSSVRNAENNETINFAASRPCDFVKHNFKDCEDLVNTRNQYTTKFIEITDFKEKNILRVGDTNSGGYWSNLFIKEMTDSLKNLSKAENKGKLLKINFSVQEEDGFQYHILESISY